MAFNSSTFIASYVSTDVVIKFKDTAGTIKNSIMVGRVQKIATEGKQLWIIMENSKQIALDFSSTADAQLAQVALNTAISTLYPNYRNLGGPVINVAVPQSIVGITLANYIIAKNANSLVPLQWYSISDSLNSFGLGTTLLVMAKTNNDATPEGVANGKLIAINVDNTTVLRYQDPTNKNVAINESSITATSSTYLFAENKSSIAGSGSNRVEARNDSNVTVVNSSYIVAVNNSDITLNGANNCSFDNISGDFSAVSGLSDIIVNKTSSVGKEGEQTMSGTQNEVLKSYVNTIAQKVPALAGNLTKRIDNPFVDANAKFIFFVDSSIGSSSFIVQDKNGATLATINKTYLDSFVTFVFDKNTGLFKLEPEQLFAARWSLVIFAGNQTTFSLPYEPKKADASHLTVNGVKATYTTDYTISGTTLVWTNTSYSLETSDSMEIIYI